MMKGIDLVKSDNALTVRAIAAIIFGFCLASCTNNSLPVPEAEYSTKIIGRWQGIVGNSKETMSINHDGTFVCQLQPTGFISNTLSQGVMGTVQGTWKITGAIITLKITGEENERLKNKSTSSTILAMKEDKLTLKSDRGDTSSFRRTRAFWFKSYRKTKADARGAQEASSQQPEISPKRRINERTNT